jgi:hypothetical protein
MASYEVRRVSGKGFVFDTPIKAYKDLGEAELQDLKLAHGVNMVGQMIEFVALDDLIAEGKTREQLTPADVDALQTCWKGKPLAPGTVYCVIMDAPEEGGAGMAEAVKKAFEMKIEDRVVMAEDKKHFAAGATQETRKNVAAADKAEGGVWGVRRKGPPR